MENALQFLMTYNIQIIKGVIGIVFLALIIYVYRMFFLASASGASEAAINTDAIEQKLNQLIETQKNRPAAEPSEMPDSSQPIGDVDRLKLEVYTLKQQLNEAERKAVESAKAAPAVDPDLLAKHAEQVKSLESRLAEYEIIAEDIAELSQLRIENGKLKDQLAGAGIAVASAGSAATTAPPMAEVSKAETSKAEEVAVESAALETAPVAATAPEVSAEEKLIQELLAQADADAAAAAANPPPPEVLSAQDATDSLIASIAADAKETAVSEADQKLLEEFEQTIIKKG